ncbi:MAG TPA: glycine zipper 2TM domain-containing protein [Geobacteraceae bacterium]
MMKWKEYATIALSIAIIANTAGCTPYQTQGGAAGGAIGGITGALLDSRNPWRGGVIGAALGAIAGATIADISARGSQEAVASGRPVEYRTEDGRGRYYAEPAGPGPSTHCKRVRERVYEDGRLVREHVREVCTGERYEPGY